MDEKTIANAIRISFRTLIKPLEGRLIALEDQMILDNKRRIIDSHICAQLYQHLIDKRVISADEIKRDIRFIGNTIKQAGNNEWVSNELVDAQVKEWTDRIGD